MKDNPTENPKPRRKKLYLVLKAAIFGAVIFDAMILIDNLAPSNDNSTGLAFLLAMPPAFVGDVLRLGHMANPYIVNGFLGAIIFAIIAVFWQSMKGDAKK
jgi:hypothetical protein